MLWYSMTQIRETIEALCTVLNNHCPDKIFAENVRRAKFDKDEATEILWQTLSTVLCKTESLQPVDKSNHNAVKFCKHKLFHKGYRVKDFFRLPEDMSHGSREVMMALGWLMAKEDIVGKFIANLEPFIFEDPPIDLSLHNKIPLPNSPVGSTEVSRHKLKVLENSVDVADQLILKYNKLHLSLKSLLASKNEYTKIVCKLHSVPKTLKSQSSGHFSSQDVYFLRHPKELSKYQEKLEWFCHYTKALIFWSMNELTFWKWMESVVVTKALPVNVEEKEDEFENTAGGCQQNQHFTPSRTLQKAKEHQVELSQVLNSQEAVYRKVSKTWKKIKANLQQSFDKKQENLSELLSALDGELLVETKELARDFKKPHENFCNFKPRRVSLCLKKLNNTGPKTGRVPKEVVNNSVTSEEITRLTQEKQALEYKLRNLQEQHRVQLFQISQSHPNLVCISSDFKASNV